MAFFNCICFVCSHDDISFYCLFIVGRFEGPCPGQAVQPWREEQGCDCPWYPDDCQCMGSSTIQEWRWNIQNNGQNVLSGPLFRHHHRHPCHQRMMFVNGTESSSRNIFIYEIFMKGLASHCFSKTTFTFHFSILNIVKCFLKHLKMFKMEK